MTLWRSVCRRRRFRFTGNKFSSRSDDFEIPEFKIQRLPVKSTLPTEVDSFDLLEHNGDSEGSPDKKRKRGETNDSGVEGLSVDPRYDSCKIASTLNWSNK